MLAWALWLALALLHWLKWGWQCLSEGGLWRPLPIRRRGGNGAKPSEGDAEQAPPSANPAAHEVSDPPARD
jgi:hypothetical protein